MNPDHLELVTRKENILRGTSPAALHATKTQCPQGHPYDDNNTMTWKGQRKCRTCHRQREALRRAA